MTSTSVVHMLIHTVDGEELTLCVGAPATDYTTTDKISRVTCEYCARSLGKERLSASRRMIATSAAMSGQQSSPKHRKRHLDAATAAIIIFLAIIVVITLALLVLFYNLDVTNHWRWGDVALWGCVLGATILLVREIRKWSSKTDSESTK